jgi:excisionase family DNA binding protein
MLETQVFTPKEASQYLKINSQVLQKYLRQGILPARKVGRQWRLSKLALDFWLAPSLARFLPRAAAWQEIFSLGDQIGEKISLSEDEVLKEVRDLRKKRGLKFKGRS